MWKSPAVTSSIFRIQVIVESSETDVAEVVEKIERSLCPDPEHAGPCPVPWTIVTSEMEEPEASGWRESFEDERR